MLSGYVDLDVWRGMGLLGRRVLLDGRDVTDRCVRFDYDRGHADLLIGDPPLVDSETGEPEIERVYGHIIIA